MIQAFKNLTIVMAHKTNAGMTDGSHVASTTEGGTGTAADIKDIEAFRLKGDLRYTPVVLNDDGLGVALAKDQQIHGGEDTLPTGAVIGVLMESFDKPMHEHEVMIHGVVPMVAQAEIKPGNPVYWDETNKKATATVPSTSGKGIYYIGLALTHAKLANNHVDVLIGK